MNDLYEMVDRIQLDSILSTILYNFFFSFYL